MIIKCIYDEKVYDLLNGALHKFYDMKQTDVRMNIQISMLEKILLLFMEKVFKTLLLDLNSMDKKLLQT